MSDLCDHSLGGRELTLQEGKLARQAGGVVTVRYGSTTVLVTACSGAEPGKG